MLIWSITMCSIAIVGFGLIIYAVFEFYKINPTGIIRREKRNT